jgi:catechol 2,3-dioxygenase-like lactoylglutathione lyase family enzyme
MPNRQIQIIIRAVLLFTLICTAVMQSVGAGEPAVAEPTGKPKMKYVDSTEQLVVELYVRNVGESAAFYEKLGFKVIRRETTFVELGWEDSLLFLEQLPGQPAPPTTLVANIRIMVDDVDRYWKLCQEMRLPVKRPIGDRYYGLRDFTVASPDGIGLRFASNLPGKPAK